MAYSTRIQLNRVICRDRETLTTNDMFAMAGAVIIDGKVSTFTTTPMAINERMGWQSFHPNESVIYDGFSESRQIGLVLRGYDIDNNTWWKKNRKKLKEASDTVAEFAGYVPVVGEYAAKILKAWPKVVDAAVALDKNDVLLSLSTVVNLPDVSPMLFRKSFHPVDIRFARNDWTGYSDWDYSLQIGITYENLDVPSFGRVAKETVVPFRSSTSKDWLGDWTSDRVSCNIRRSGYGSGLFDVEVTERGHGAGVPRLTVAVPISKVFLEQMAVETVQVNAATAANANDKAVTSNTMFTRTIVERSISKRVALIEGSVDVVLPPNLLDAAAGARAVDPALALGRTARSTRSKRRPVDQVSRELVVPARERSGADLLELDGDAVLEMYEIRHDGKRTPGRELRYIRPVTGIATLAYGSIDTTLRRPINV
jgi:hypothetical protein